MRNRYLARSCALCLSLAASAHAQSKNDRPPAAASAPQAQAGAKQQPGKPGAKGRAKREAQPSSQHKAAIESARHLLASSKKQDVEAGIQSLGLLGDKEAVEPLAIRIREGLPPDLLEAALITLMALGQPNAGPVLYELTTHRRPQIRLRAIEAIVATHPPGAEHALLAALSDAEPSVRSAAATGLGELGATSALEKLFLALDRDNLEASTAIGKVIVPGEVGRLVNYLGRLPFQHLGPALTQVFVRTDVTDRAKLDIVARLEEVGTVEVKGYLNDLVASSGESLPPSVSRALLHAMQEIAN